MTRTLRIHGPARLSGSITPPPDKSVAHRALLLAALGQGRFDIRPYRPGADVAATEDAIRSFGVSVSRAEDACTVFGAGPPDGWPGRPPRIDCGNSGTTMRLLAGLAAARSAAVVLDGDASLRRRPMERLRVLEKMGATFSGPSPLRAPFTVGGGNSVRGAEVNLPVASAQVKSALLLLGLFANEPTVVTEPRRSRDHTERWLAWLGASIEESSVDGRHRVRSTPPANVWSGRELVVVADVSSAAFILAAALITESAKVQVRAGTNPTRTGVLDVLTAMGAVVEREPLRSAGPEPEAWLSVGAPEGLVGTRVSGELALRSLDELPLILGLAAFADGWTEVADAAELRVKESDRIAAMEAVLSCFGAECAARPDGLRVRGGRLRPATVDAAGDHRVAMTAAVMALGLEGTSRVLGADVIDVSFPGFVTAMRSLGADLDWED